MILLGKYYRWLWVEDGEACLGAIDGHRIDVMQLDAGSMTLMKETLEKRALLDRGMAFCR